MAQNLQQASKKAIQQSKVDMLDSIGHSKEQFDTNITNAIEIAVEEFIERIHQNIKSEDMVVTGSMSDITMQSEHGNVKVYANPWLIFQDRGVNGSVEKLYDTPFSYKDKMPPIQPFIDYIKDKNIRLKDNAKYGGEESPFKELTEDEQIERVAWAMARKVFISGLKPRRIVSKEINGLKEDLVKHLGQSVVSNLNLIFNMGSKSIEVKL